MVAANKSLIGRFFEKQLWQLLILGALFVSFSLGYELLAVPPGQWLGLTTKQWFLIATISPIIHQIYVWLCWRGELYFKAVTKVFGRHAYQVFSIVFALLIVIRFFSIIGICVADYQSLTMPSAIRYPLAFILHLPALYAIYSVARYFGINRIPGEDHFKPEEYRNKPFIRKGMYKYSANVMYVYVGLIFWATAVLCASKAGLLTTLYMYATVWTHYFCTEKPDIKYIYS